MDSLHPAPIDPNRDQLRHPQGIEPVTFSDRVNSVSFSDERRRAGQEVAADAFASVTLSGRDSSWGEFLTRNDVLALRAWLDVLLHDDH